MYLRIFWGKKKGSSTPRSIKEIPPIQSRQRRRKEVVGRSQGGDVAENPNGRGDKMRKAVKVSPRTFSSV